MKLEAAIPVARLAHAAVVSFDLGLVGPERAQDLPRQIMVTVTLPVAAGQIEERGRLRNHDMADVAYFGFPLARPALVDIDRQALELGNEIVKSVGGIFALPAFHRAFGC